MTKRMRVGLGVLCVAAICLVIGVGLGQGDEGTAADRLGGLLVLGAAVFGIAGLAALAVGLLRSQADD